MRVPSAVAALAVAALLVGPAQAHHAVNAQFDVNKTITLKGVLTQIDWINPHSYFHYDVTTSTGEVQKWAFESPGPNTLRRAGLSNKNFFKIGEVYTIETNPARDGSHIGTFGIVTFPDGKKVVITAVDPAGALK